MSTDRSPAKKRGVRISQPADIEKAIAKGISEIFRSDNLLDHLGKLSQLANSWCAARKIRLEYEEIEALKTRLTVIEESRNG